MVVWVSAINSVNTSLPMPYQSQTFICFLFGTSVITSLSGRRVFGCVFWRFIRIRKSRYWWFSVWSLLNTTGYTSCIFFTRFCYNKNTSYIHQFDCDCFFSIFSKYKVCFFFRFPAFKAFPATEVPIICSHHSCFITTLPLPSLLAKRLVNPRPPRPDVHPSEIGLGLTTPC